jgi:hypothetical protein
MIPVPLLNPKFAIAFAAQCARTWGSGHWDTTMRDGALTAGPATGEAIGTLAARLA